MPVTLHQRLLHESPGVAPALPRGLRLPWRDSATQQLDALEAANRRLSANRMGGNGAWIGLVALALLVALSTSSWQPSARPQAAAPTAAGPALLPLPVLAAAQPQPLPIVQPEAAAPAPALALIDEAAQRQAARARALAEARRQAARAAQERALGERDALRASERRHAERPAEPAPARVDAPAPALQLVAHAAPRASVREACSGAGFIGQTFCHARECRKSEHLGDATCVRLREIEQSRVRTEQ